MQGGLCLAWSETQTVGFLTQRLIHEQWDHEAVASIIIALFIQLFCQITEEHSLYYLPVYLHIYHRSSSESSWPPTSAPSTSWTSVWALCRLSLPHLLHLAPLPGLCLKNAGINLITILRLFMYSDDTSALFVLSFNFPVNKFSVMLGWSNHYLGINQYSVELTCLAQGHKMVPQLGPEVIKLFSISAQLSMKFQLLINVEIIKISGKFRFKTQKLVIYPANKC